MSWENNNNNNNIIAFGHPAIRYKANYDDDDARLRYSQQQSYWLPEQSVYYVTQPKRAVAPGWLRCCCCTITSRTLWCTILGAILLLSLIGIIVGVILGIGRNNGSNNNSTTVTPIPLLSQTTPMNPSGTASAQPSGVSPGVTVSGSILGSTSPGGRTNPATVPSISQSGGTSVSGVTERGSTVSGTLPTGSMVPNPSASPGIMTRASQEATKATEIARTGSVASQGTITELPVNSETTVRITGTNASRGTATTLSSASAATTSAGLTVTTEQLTTRPPIVPCPTQPVMIYQRVDASDYFNKSWSQMKSEFGSKEGNYWRGLNDISALTKTKGFRLVVYFNSAENEVTYMSQYGTFQVGDESTGFEYVITISEQSSNFTADAFFGYTGYKFQTYDKNPGGTAPSGPNCAAQTGGAWWYGSTCDCGACLTQVGPEQFEWKRGFTSIKIRKAWMMLECK